MPRAMSKPVRVKYFRMETWESMARALHMVPNIGWTGTLVGTIDGSKTLELSCPEGGRCTGNVGETLIYNGTNVSTMPDCQFDEQYLILDEDDAESKPVEVLYFPLDTWQALALAWHDALAVGYYGHIESRLDGALTLRLSGPTQLRIDVKLGENLIWNGASFAVLDDEKFAEQYTVIDE